MSKEMDDFIEKIAKQQLSERGGVVRLLENLYNFLEKKREAGEKFFDGKVQRDVAMATIRQAQEFMKPELAPVHRSGHHGDFVTCANCGGAPHSWEMCAKGLKAAQDNMVRVAVEDELKLKNIKAGIKAQAEEAWKHLLSTGWEPDGMNDTLQIAWAEGNAQATATSVAISEGKEQVTNPSVGVDLRDRLLTEEAIKAAVHALGPRWERTSSTDKITDMRAALYAAATVAFVKKEKNGEPSKNAK